MGNVNVLHRKHVELESNIQFYKQEINFLLKILTKEYSISIAHEKIVKLLDSYWKAFEKYYQELEELEGGIKIEENKILFLCKNEEGQLPLDEIDEEKLLNTYSKIIISLNNLKENLYKYMESDMKHKLTLSLL